jgi:hypothetical protein
MPYLDTRCLTSSSLIPTSIIYYNNRNIYYSSELKVYKIIS